MRNAKLARGLCLATPLLVALTSACADTPASSEAAAQPAVIAAPLWINGDFETDAIGATPPSGWTLTTYLNGTASTRGAVSGSPSTPPTTFAQLNLGTPGAGQVETYTIGGTTKRPSPATPTARRASSSPPAAAPVA